MIPRYISPAMGRIWSDENKFALWFEIEAQVCEALAALGTIPQKDAEIIRANGAKAIEEFTQADHDRILEIEAQTRHDVIAYLTWLGEKIGPSSRFVHQGLTSSDMLDTAFSLQLTQAADLLIEDLDALLSAIKARALEHKYTPTMGRSHGIHAEPTTFGLKLATFYAEFDRNKKRLIQAREEIATCALSGPVGTFAHVSPEIERRVAQNLGLAVEPVSTQIIPRDRHAAFFCTLAIIASSIERLAVEIRHLQRTEVAEAAESFGKGQKGSSAMPHKKNPVLSENLTGLARLVRSYAFPALENVALWHERDISHSSVERNIAPDATEALDFSLKRLTGVIENLAVDADRMKANLDSTGGLYESGAALLALTQVGFSREDAYKMAQSAAMKTWEDLKTSPEDRGRVFRDNLLANPALTQKISKEEWEKILNADRHFAYVDDIFARVFGE